MILCFMILLYPAPAQPTDFPVGRWQFDGAWRHEAEFFADGSYVSPVDKGYWAFDEFGTLWFTEGQNSYGILMSRPNNKLCEGTTDKKNPLTMRRLR